MLITPQKVEITLCSKTIPFYINKGYNLESLKNEKGKIPRRTKLLVDVKDLQEGSAVKVRINCDYCGKEFPKEYREFITQNINGIIHKDCCSDKKCANQKTIESNLIKYNKGNVFQVKEFQDKYKHTMQENYGVDWCSQIEGHLEKIKSTNNERYGVDFYTQTDEFKERIINTNNKKYGTDYHTKTSEFKLKVINTNMKRYGVPNVMQVESIKNKLRISLVQSYYKNGTGKASNQQRYLCNLLNGELNYPMDKFMLDITFPESKIYIEFNGGGHDLQVKSGRKTQEEFNKLEIKRFYFNKNRGWKQIRIISEKDYLPFDDIIIDMINQAKGYLNSGHSWIEFNIDTQTVKCSQYEKKFDFGELRKIKKEDIA